MSFQLTIRDLEKTYANGVRALQGVSLDIGTGMFGLLGPNGAGKSTLMRTLATLQEPDGGSARLGDLDLLRDKQATRRVLGYLPQEFGVYPKITAHALLSHLAVLKGVPRERRREVVDGLLHQVNLWDVRKSRLGSFSGGMKQRFGIAQALLGDPRLIIVDEPTAGLDPAERLRFHNLLAELGENIIVILSTHIVEDVADLCQQMAILAGGRVLLTARPQAAVERLAGRIWRKVVERHQLPAYEERLPVISTHLWMGRPVVHVYADERPEEGFEQTPGTLEDVYFSALRGLPERLAA
jgi:ABC-type multidrug transport system ATPase subunit